MLAWGYAKPASVNPISLHSQQLKNINPCHHPISHSFQVDVSPEINLDKS